jgi:hypothetical protein
MGTMALEQAAPPIFEEDRTASRVRLSRVVVVLRFHMSIVEEKERSGWLTRETLADVQS